MSGQKCSYFLCSKSKKNTPGLRKFSFPVNDPDRCAQWIINSGNTELTQIPLEKLRSKFICGNHFKQEHLLVKKLSATAVPLPHALRTEVESKATYSKKNPEQDLLEPQPSTSSADFEYYDPVQPSTSACTEVRYLTPVPFRTSPRKRKALVDSSVEAIIDMPSPKKRLSPDTPRKVTLRKKLFTVQQKLDRVRTDLKRKTYLTVPRSVNQLTSFNRAFITMQLYHRKRTAWSAEEKKAALALFYKSPTTYKFMRSKGCILPSPSTIASWMQKYNYSPGYNKYLFSVLKLKVETMQKKTRECILLFDEMAIKKYIEFSKYRDLIEGFEDLGEFGRRPVCAKQALVLMVRGLYANWKIPLSFYFTENGVKAEQLLDIIKKNLGELSSVGLNPVAIVCDQSTTNQRVFKHLNITIEQPFFYFNEHKYFALFDPPHILKCLRNNLLNGCFLIEENLVNFEDIKSVYTLDKSSTTGKALPKITDAHLDPSNFQKMNVKLAAQVFSHSVAAALRTAIDSGEIQSPSAKHTADFVELVDNTFDALNSRNLYAIKKCNRAITDVNDAPMKALASASEVFNKIQKLTNTGQIKRPPCFDSFLITIKAVQLIFEEQKGKGYSFLLTSRLNQDVLENQFSIYRQRGGYSRNPTVRTFQAAFKSNLIMNLMKPVKTSNCEPDSTINLLALPDFREDVEIEDESEETVSSSDSSEGNDVVAENFAVSLEESSVVYFAGYLLKKCLDKFNCSDCKDKLSSNDELTDENDILLFYKNYNINDPCSLKKPSDLLHNFTHIAMKLFAKFFLNKWNSKKLSKLLSRYIVKRISKQIPDWFKDNSCTGHREYILDLLIRTLIYKQCKSYSSSIKQSTTIRKPDKLKILQNI